MTPSIIKDSLEKGLSYPTYRAHIKSLLSTNTSTGNNQTADLVEYSRLNDRRMDRLDKTLRLDEGIRQELEQLNQPLTLLVIAEGWCGDAAQIVPVINKVAEASQRINLRIVLRDEQEALMNLFLTNGSKAIPKVIVLNQENDVLNSWGPRPSHAQKMVRDYKEKNGCIDAEFKKELQLWYNKDKGLHIQKDLLQILQSSIPEHVNS
ncbi:MAG: thioredoxin family protein [Lutibacter sp.]|nr:thioredoxin family protein [Lutibacter sp.]